MLALFTISGILLTTFFSIRFWELKIGKKTLFGKLTSKTDAFFYSCMNTCSDAYKALVTSIHHLFTHHVPSHSEKMWDGVRRFAQAKQTKARDVLRGRKVLKEGGNVSFFLKNISDARRNNGEGGSIVG